jgi:polyribonucleotide nucleotidyltransferase
MRLSRRALMPAPEGWVERERKPRTDRPEKPRGDRKDDRRPKKQ